MMSKPLSIVGSQSSRNETDGSQSSILFPRINTRVAWTTPLHNESTATAPSDIVDAEQSSCAPQPHVPDDDLKPKKPKGGPVFPMKPHEKKAEKHRRKELLPRIDQSRVVRGTAEEICDQWIISHRQEQSAAVAVMEVARELFYDVVVCHHTFIPNSGHEQLRLLAVRAAVSCFLLEEIVKSLPRHNDVLRPYVGVLVRSVYVPDTPAVRNALGGSIAYEQLFNDIPPAFTSQKAAVVRSLLANYARKPYFVAHHELTQKAIAYAHDNTSQKQHFKQLSNVFALLNHNWIKSFLRIVVKAWRCVCQKRRESEQKLRARWAQRFAGVRIRTGVREWRVFATYRLQRAAAAENLKAQIRTIESNIRNLEEQIQELTTESAALVVEYTAKNNKCTSMEKQIAEREEEYKIKLNQVCEMDSVGSKLLDTLLQRMPFPAAGMRMPPLELLVLWANTMLVESAFGPLYLYPTDEEIVDFVENMHKARDLRGEEKLVALSDVSDAALPFTPLLAEAVTVYVPLYRYMALMRVMDAETGPTNEEFKSVSLSDRRIWERHSAMEAEVLSSVSGAAAKGTASGSSPKGGEKGSEDFAEMEKMIGDIVIDSYKRVTGSESVVTAAQLLTRQRGAQLVFLASLMRYFANWIESKVKKEHEGSTDTSCRYSSSTATATTIDGEIVMHNEEHLAAIDRFRGTRHPRYREWFYPPHTHLEWATRVESQRHWVAASFSALHAAVNTARAPHVVLSRAEEEAMPTFMANITLARISDILPSEAIDSPTLLLRIVRCVETPFPYIHALFALYAIPFTAPNKETVLCVTALDFWRMLCDCRVVGGRGKMHRVAVRRIITCIADASMANTRTATSKSPSAAGVPKNPSRRGHGGTRDAAEVDLTNLHYRTRLDAAEFTEALLRCAQVWDGMLNLQPRPVSAPPSQASSPKSQITSKQQSPLSHKHQKHEQEQQEEQQQQQEQEQDHPLKVTSDAETPTASSGCEAPGEEYIHYEPYDVKWTLHPSALNTFFFEWIIPHGFRGPALSAFRRGIRHSALRERFSTHLDALFGIFAGYARPKEAYGIRIGGTADGAPRHSQFGSVDVGVARVLSLHGIQRMARDFSWYDVRRITRSVVEELFFGVAADKDREPNVLFFPEWLDIICAFSMYYDPNPARPLHEKTNAFLDNFVLRHYKGED